MTGLERKAHRLVELSRAGDEPSAAQLVSLHGAVAARIAAEGALSAAGGAAATKVAKVGALVKGLVAAGAVATGAAGFFALQSSAVESVAPVIVAQARAPARALPQQPIIASARPLSVPAEAPVEATSAVVAAVRPAKPAASLRLQDEAALLSEVQGALRAGKADVALSKLEGYDRRFPTGMLRAEADAARVFALCAAGRVDKARTYASRFVQRYPNAPATSRVQSACK
jgi:hypothetical protein